MKKPLILVASGLAGLTTAGLTVSLLAFPSVASDGNLAVKREEDTPDIVLVADDDDDDLLDDDVQARVDDTNTRSKNTRSKNTRTKNTRDKNTRTGNSGDRTRTGARSGRDDSRSGRAKIDWTHDGPGPKTRDWSKNHTNDRSRNNTRGRG